MQAIFATLMSVQMMMNCLPPLAKTLQYALCSILLVYETFLMERTLQRYYVSLIDRCVCGDFRPVQVTLLPQRQALHQRSSQLPASAGILSPRLYLLWAQIKLSPLLTRWRHHLALVRLAQLGLDKTQTKAEILISERRQVFTPNVIFNVNMYSSAIGWWPHPIDWLESVRWPLGSWRQRQEAANTGPASSKCSAGRDTQLRYCDPHSTLSRWAV